MMMAARWFVQFKETVRGMNALVDPNNILDVGL